MQRCRRGAFPSTKPPHSRPCLHTHCLCYPGVSHLITLIAQSKKRWQNACLLILVMRPPPEDKPLPQGHLRMLKRVTRRA